jgi:hypothetical protein
VDEEAADFYAVFQQVLENRVGAILLLEQASVFQFGQVVVCDGRTTQVQRPLQFAYAYGFAALSRNR